MITTINATTIKSIIVSTLLCGCRNSSSSARNELLLLHVGVVIIKSTSATALSRDNNIIVSFLDDALEKSHMKKSQVTPTINDPLESSHQRASAHDFPL